MGVCREQIMKKSLTVLLLILLLLQSGCTLLEPNKTALNLDLGNYEYTARDPQGDIIAKGKFTIYSLISGLTIGEWEIKTLVAADKSGPQNGKGTIKLKWDEQNNTILNLNPDKTESRVLLIGNFVNGIYSGKWIWDFVHYSKEGGSFTAILKK
jgi:hypothetical protein